jgi:hypothetical protein
MPVTTISDRELLRRFAEAHEMPMGMHIPQSPTLAPRLCIALLQCAVAFAAMTVISAWLP